MRVCMYLCLRFQHVCACELVRYVYICVLDECGGDGVCVCLRVCELCRDLEHWQEWSFLISQPFPCGFKKIQSYIAGIYVHIAVLNA